MKTKVQRGAAESQSLVKLLPTHRLVRVICEQEMQKLQDLKTVLESHGAKISISASIRVSSGRHSFYKSLLTAKNAKHAK
jgi:hypothetical protein